MNAPFIAPRAPGVVRRLLACAVAGIATAILRADLVTMHVSYSGGSPSAHLHVSLGTESLRLDGSAAEGAFSVSLHPEEAMLVQIMGDGIGDYRVSFSPPPPFGMIIEVARRSAFASASASPRPVNHPLLVTMVRHCVPPDNTRPRSGVLDRLAPAKDPRRQGPVSRFQSRRGAERRSPAAPAHPTPAPR